jgi:hypothetical protein
MRHCTAAAKRQVQEAQTARAEAEAELQQQQQQSHTEAVVAKRQQESRLTEVQRAAEGKMREYVDKFRQQVGLAALASSTEARSTEARSAPVAAR